MYEQKHAAKSDAHAVRDKHEHIADAHRRDADSTAAKCRVGLDIAVADYGPDVRPDLWFWIARRGSNGVAHVDAGCHRGYHRSGQSDDRVRQFRWHGSHRVAADAGERRRVQHVPIVTVLPVYL
jgi:hypothetical protein